MVPAAVAELVLSVAGYLYFHRTPKLTNRTRSSSRILPTLRAILYLTEL
jgi:hypothetical protein